MSASAAEPEAVAFAESVLAEEPFRQLLYARVDLVEMDGSWANHGNWNSSSHPCFSRTHDDAPPSIGPAISARLDRYGSGPPQ